MLGEPFKPLGSAKLLPAGEARTWYNRKCTAYINGKRYLRQLSLISKPVSDSSSEPLQHGAVEGVLVYIGLNLL